MAFCTTLIWHVKPNEPFLSRPGVGLKSFRSTKLGQKTNLLFIFEPFLLHLVQPVGPIVGAGDEVGSLPGQRLLQRPLRRRIRSRGLGRRGRMSFTLQPGDPGFNSCHVVGQDAAIFFAEKIFSSLFEFREASVYNFLVSLMVKVSP